MSRWLPKLLLLLWIIPTPIDLAYALHAGESSKAMILDVGRGRDSQDEARAMLVSPYVFVPDSTIDHVNIWWPGYLSGDFLTFTEWRDTVDIPVPLMDRPRCGFVLQVLQLCKPEIKRSHARGSFPMVLDVKFEKLLPGVPFEVATAGYIGPLHACEHFGRLGRANQSFFCDLNLSLASFPQAIGGEPKREGEGCDGNSCEGRPDFRAPRPNFLKSGADNAASKGATIVGLVVFFLLCIGVVNIAGHDE